MAEVDIVGIVGSGVMGAGLVEVVAHGRGITSSPVRGPVPAPTPSSPTVDRQPRRQIDKGALPARRARRGPRPDHRDRPPRPSSPSCDLVIESIVEDLPTKRELFAELEQVVKPSAILATNTSTLPVVELAMATQRPDQVCGIHFFNPATADAPRRGRPPDHRQRRHDQDGVGVRHDVRQGRHRGRRPRRVRRQRPAVPVPQQRRADVRAGHGGDGRHRHGDVWWMQLPDGPVRPARPRRPRHVGRHPRGAVRRVRRSEPRAGADAAPQGGRRPARTQVGPRASIGTDPCRTEFSGDMLVGHAAAGASTVPSNRRATRWALPSPRTADRDGIAGVGGDLEPGTLLEAYRRGLFPMPFGRRRLAWFSPDPRAIIPLDGLVVSRSLRRSVRPLRRPARHVVR